MKKNIFIFAFLLSLFTACESKLDIVPKGQAVLTTVEELESLLNQRYGFSTPMGDLALICNEACAYMSTVSTAYSQPNTLEHAYLFWDESIDRAALSTSDGTYNAIYQYVNYMNVILDKIDDAEGDAHEKEVVTAEAHIMRAYLHWLGVNIYAKQYDEATAATEGGIPYVTDIDVTVQKEKLTLQEVYDNILADCAQEYIDALPDEAPSCIRAGKSWGYAVRAKVLMQMKRYDEALAMANRALEYQNAIEDRSYIVETGMWSLNYDSPNNILFMAGMISPVMELISPETVAKFEEGDYVKDYDFMTWSDASGEATSGVSGSSYCLAFGVWGNSFGLTVERIMYVAAECYIRSGEIETGLGLVNKIREKRIHPDYYQPFSATTEEEAMTFLQDAKWIECIGTYENFFDCKRWNSEEKYRRTITKTIPINGEEMTFSIAPDSPLWVLPFPSNAVQYNSSLTQNY